MANDYRKLLWSMFLLTFMLGGVLFYNAKHDEEKARISELPVQRIKLADLVTSAPLENRHVELTDFIWDGRYVFQGEGKTHWTNAWVPICSKGELNKKFLVIRTGPIMGESELNRLLQASSIDGNISATPESLGLVVSQQIKEFSPETNFPVWVIDTLQSPHSNIRIAIEYWCGIGGLAVSGVLLATNVLLMLRRS